jgi:NAD(P)-dependent dehydrogenase (short-subunit alcohol dehydrogenase family)
MAANAGLQGKTAIVTGAAGILGFHVARRFAREGANVVIVDRPESSGDKIKAMVRREGGACVFVAADVRMSTDWQRVAACAVDLYGSIDVLVNNAALSAYNVDDVFDEGEWHRLLDVNLKGVFLGIKHIVPAMTATGGGSVVNVASVVALTGVPGGHLGYVASKGAVASLTRATAARFGRHGVRVNTVYPGLMAPMAAASNSPRDGATEGPTSNTPDANRERVLSKVALGRAGRSDEVANAIFFLASDEASYITGADLVVDGGFTS